MTDFIPYPMILHPIQRSAVWGGTRLLTDFGKKRETPRPAESWELSVREQENSTVENGPFAGRTVRDLLRAHPKEMLGTECPPDPFPLLFKLIDAGDDLSVQVHPDGDCAARFGAEGGKCEMWVVLEAGPDSSVVYGLKACATVADLAAALSSGRVREVLSFLSVQAGDVLFIPPGMVHALGRGTVVAEIQQNADVTYRLYDYDRAGLDGLPRPLQVGQALEAARVYSPGEIDRMRFSRAGNRTDPSLLCACDSFTVRRLSPGDTPADLAPGGGFVLLFTADSSDGSLDWSGGSIPLRRGMSVFLPASLGTCRAGGCCSLLTVTL